MDFTLAFLQIFAWVIYLVLPLLSFLMALVVILGQIVCRVEGWSRFDALYWSLITATTVGYGDIRPTKRASKAISVLIAIVGMMFTGIIIAVTLASASISLENTLDSEIIERLKQQFGRGQNEFSG